MVDNRRCDSSKLRSRAQRAFFRMANFRSGRIERGRVDRTTACCVLCCSKVDLQLFCRTVNWDVARHRPESHPAATKILKAASYRLTRCGSTLRSRDGRECFKCFKVYAKRQKMWVLPLPVALRSLQLGRACDVAGWARPWPMAACSRAKLKISRRWRITSRPTRSWGLAVIRAYMQVQKRVGKP